MVYRSWGVPSHHIVLCFYLNEVFLQLQIKEKEKPFRARIQISLAPGWAVNFKSPKGYLSWNCSRSTNKNLDSEKIDALARSCTRAWGLRFVNYLSLQAEIMWQKNMKIIWIFIISIFVIPCSCPSSSILPFLLIILQVIIYVTSFSSIPYFRISESVF